MRLTVARRRAPNECRLSDGVAEQSVEWKDARIREVKAHPDLVRLERVGERLGLRVMRARGLGAVAGREGRTTQYVLGHVTPGQRRHRREVLRTIHAIGGDLVVQYRRYVRAYALRNPVPGVDADDLEGESALAVPLALARLDLAIARCACYRLPGVPAPDHFMRPAPRVWVSTHDAVKSVGVCFGVGEIHEFANTNLEHAFESAILNVESAAAGCRGRRLSLVAAIDAWLGSETPA